METRRTDGGRVSIAGVLLLLLHSTRDIRDDSMAWLQRDHVSQVEVESIVSAADSQFYPDELAHTT